MAAILQPPFADSGSLPRKRFTRQEVERMLELDIFAGQRFELIDGDLIDKMGQNPPHAFCIMAACQALARVFGLAFIRVQLSMEAAGPDRDWSVPEPDVAVLAEVKDEYRRRHPRGDELVLAVEISDTTIRGDLTRKRDLYARAGVPEYWVLDVNQRELTIHRNLKDGTYAQVSKLADNASASIGSASILVSELLP